MNEQQKTLVQRRIDELKADMDGFVLRANWPRALEFADQIGDLCKILDIYAKLEGASPTVSTPPPRR